MSMKKETFNSEKLMSCLTQSDLVGKMSSMALVCSGLFAAPLFSSSLGAVHANVGIETVMQSVKVKGTVLDKNQTPIIGATVMVEGTSTGTITDLDGNYFIEVPNKNSKLVVSYIGYTTQSVDVDGRTSINVILYEENFNLDEVVVVGYNTVKRGQITGSVDMVKGEKISLQTSANLEDRLQGKVAGLMISSGSGQPGSSDIKIRIRGTGSINGSNTPLYILDGVMIEPAQFASLNNNDIADIQILKDASATAIYGSRGANGVIVITSKRGKEGKTQVNYNLRLGTSLMRDPKTRMMNSEENILYQQYCVEANPLSTSFPLMQILRKEAEGTATAEELARLATARGTDTDWLDEMTQNGFTMEHLVSLNGGNEKTKFFVSGSYLQQDGILVGSGLQRFSGRINLDHKLNKVVDLGVSANIGYTDSKFADPDTGEGRNGWTNPFFTALLAYPYESPDNWYNGDNPTLITKYYGSFKYLLRRYFSSYPELFYCPLSPLQL